MKAKRIGDMDGDGWVFEAELRRYPVGKMPYVRFSVNNGAAQSSLDVRPDEIDEFYELVKAAREALKAMDEK